MGSDPLIYLIIVFSYVLLYCLAIVLLLQIFKRMRQKKMLRTSSGIIEMKYMTAKEEDILMNQNYIKKGVAIDKLLKALIVTEIEYDDLIVGDKNAIMVAARVLGYGPDYTFEYEGEEHTVDLSQLENKPFNESSITLGLNEFPYTLPHSKSNITYKLLTNKDENTLTPKPSYTKPAVTKLDFARDDSIENSDIQY